MSWAPPSQEWQLPGLGIIHVFSKPHRWGKITRLSCWLWQGFLGVIPIALTWALQPTPACVAPASLSTSGPGVGVGWTRYWCLVLINHWLTTSRHRNAAWELGEKIKCSLCASKMKHLFIVAVPKEFFSSGRLFHSLSQVTQLCSPWAPGSFSMKNFAKSHSLLCCSDSHTLLKPAGQSPLMDTRVFPIHLIPQIRANW